MYAQCNRGSLDSPPANQEVTLMRYAVIFVAVITAAAVSQPYPARTVAPALSLFR
jgi:hypothetical protein